MTGKIKTLGAMLVAFGALSALAVTAAQASKIDIGSQPAVLTGHSEPIIGQENFQEHSFQITSTSGAFKSQLKCNTASFEGTTQGQSIEEATITPTYGKGKGEFSEVQGCTTSGIKSQIRMNGCKYTLTGSAQGAGTFLVDITGCTEGKQIEAIEAAGGCALKFPAQNGLSHVVAKAITAQEATLEMTLSGIKVQQAGGALCPDGATAHTGTNASLSGNTILKAFQDKETKQVTKHGHQYTEHVCGTQVNIQIT